MSDGQNDNSNGSYTPQKDPEHLPESIRKREKEYIEARREQAKFEFWLDESAQVNDDIAQAVNDIYDPVDRILFSIKMSLDSLQSELQRAGAAEGAAKIETLLREISDAISPWARGVRTDLSVQEVNERVQRLHKGHKRILKQLKGLLESSSPQWTDRAGLVGEDLADDVKTLRVLIANIKPVRDLMKDENIEGYQENLDTLLKAFNLAVDAVDSELKTANLPLTKGGDEASRECISATLDAISRTLTGLGAALSEEEREIYSAQLAAVKYAIEDIRDTLESILDDDKEKSSDVLLRYQDDLQTHHCTLIMHRTMLQELKRLLLLFERKTVLAELTSGDRTDIFDPNKDREEPLRRNDEQLTMLNAGAGPLIQQSAGGGIGGHLAPVGLAFSGGGMRSASYNLGLLQGLAELGILPHVDYLSTVSGGGYLGGCITSLLSSRVKDWTPKQQTESNAKNKKTEEEMKPPSLEPASLNAEAPAGNEKGSGAKDYVEKAGFPFSVHWPRFPLNPNIRVFKNRGDKIEVSVEDGPNAQLAHLRNKGNILIPRMGWVNRDVLRGVGGFIGGVSYTLVMVLLSLFVVAGAIYIIFAGLSPALMLAEGVQVVPAAEKSSGNGAREEPVTLTIGGEELAMSTSPPPGELTITVGGVLTTSAATASDALTLTLLSNALDLAISPPATDTVATTGGGVNAQAKAIELAAETGEPGYAPADDGATAFLALPSLPEELDQGVTRRHLLRVSTHEWDKKEWRMPWPSYGWAVLMGAIFVLIVTLALQWWQHPDRKAALTNQLGKALGEGRSREEYEDSRYIGSFSWLYVVVLLLSVFMIRGRTGGANPSGPQVFWIWLPFCFAVGAWVGLFFFRAVSAWSGRLIFRIFSLGRKRPSNRPDNRLDWSYVRFRTLYWAIQGVSLYALAIIFVLTLMIIPFFFTTPNAKGPGAMTSLATTILTAIAASLLSRFVGGKSEKQLQNMWKKWLPPAFHGGLLLYILGFLVLFLNLLLIYLALIIYDQALVTWTIGSDSAAASGLLLGLVGAALALLILAKWINFNAISPHYFYRDRLADAFLKTELEIEKNGVPGVVEDALDHRNLRLTQINPDGCSAPYHLVVTALNLPGTWRMKYKDRRAVHFVLSRFFCGSSVTGYVATKEYRKPVDAPGGVTKLSRSMALSGAAVAANVGFRTFFAQAFMLTLLNVRLGLWMVNPRQYAVPSNKVDYEKIEHPFWFPYLWDELRGRISERRKMVSLSDGAHTGDGNGLMPLLERRCKVIIVGDANEDPDYRFESLFRAIYQAKSDLDVDIQINVTPLQPEADPEEGKTGICKNHYVIGRITYPPAPKGAPTVEDDKGWLIYFKPTITEYVPSEIRQYWTTHKELFPQVTTADVFFDEEQMEAYRHIGEFSVKHAYQRILLHHFRKNWRYPSRKINDRFKSLHLREQGAASRCAYLQQLFATMLPRLEMLCDDLTVSIADIMQEVDSDQTLQTVAQKLVADPEFVTKFEAVELREMEVSGINFYRLGVSPFAEDVIDDLRAVCKPAATPPAKPKLSQAPPAPGESGASLETPTAPAFVAPPLSTPQQQSVWDDDDYGF